MIGIYELRNTRTGQRYIGSSIRLKRRLRDHKYDLRKNQHKNKHLQSAWNKYGEDTFDFRIVLVCSRDMITHYEQSFLNSLGPKDYNKNPSAGRPPSTKGKKIKVKLRPDGRRYAHWKPGERYSTKSPNWGGKGNAAWNKGKTLSAEHKKKISATLKAKGILPPWRKHTPQ
jgi:group I intron endonuclease